MNKCIRMGITASNLSFGEVNRRFYGRKLRFTAPLTRRRKTKFPTVKPPIYLPKCQIWMQLSPKWTKAKFYQYCPLFSITSAVVLRLWESILFLIKQLTYIYNYHSRSKTYLFEEFLSGWYEKLKERETTTMTVRLHKDIETYKVNWFISKSNMSKNCI